MPSDGRPAGAQTEHGPAGAQTEHGPEGAQTEHGAAVAGGTPATQDAGESHPAQTDNPAGERLHPISLLFGLGAVAWGLLAVALVSGVNSCILVLFLPSVVGSVARYLSFRYWLGEDEMVIREGILRRNERHIPYARIQNIDLIQNLLHRFFKVAVVRIETASGGTPEAVISVLTLPVIEDMRSRVFRDRSAGAGAMAEDATGDDGLLLALPTRELAIFGAISNKGLVMVAAAFGVASQTGTLDRYFDNQIWVERVIREETPVPQIPVLSSTLTTVLLVAAAVIALLLVLRLLSVLWAIIKYHAFRLDQHGDDLRAEYGLLTRVTATIPRHRIQLVTVNLTPLHRLFGRASVQVDTAGGGGSDQNNPSGVQERQWLAPVIPRRQALGLVRSVMPESRLEHLDWQPISPRAWRRLFRRWLALLLLLVAASLAPLGGWSLALAALGLPLAFVHAQLYAQRTGYALTPAAVLYRSGCWVRRVSIVPFGKIQVLGLHQTPFDQRNAMASVRVDTAGATLGGHSVAIAYLDTESARAVLRQLDEETSRTAFKW